MEEKRKCGDSVRVAGFPEPRVLSSALDSDMRRNDEPTNHGRPSVAARIGDAHPLGGVSS